MTPIHSAEGAAVLTAILAVFAAILPAVAATTNAASDDRGGSGYCCGARDRPSAEQPRSADSISTQHL